MIQALVTTTLLASLFLLATPVEGSNILLLGDSWASFVESDDLESQCQGSNVRNIAVGGTLAREWADGLLTDRLQSIEGFVPDYAWVSIGGNELLEGLEAGLCGPEEALIQISTNLRQVTNQLLERFPNVRIAMTGYGFPSVPIWDPACDGFEVVRGLNKLYTDFEYPGTTVVPVLDLFGGSLSTRSSYALSDSRFYLDSIHLNAQGYQRLFSHGPFADAIGCRSDGNDDKCDPTDCDTIEIYEPVCGSDGNTYSNQSELNCANKCKLQTDEEYIQLAYVGACRENEADETEESENGEDDDENSDGEAGGGEETDEDANEDEEEDGSGDDEDSEEEEEEGDSEESDEDANEDEGDGGSGDDEEDDEGSEEEGDSEESDEDANEDEEDAGSGDDEDEENEEDEDGGDGDMDFPHTTAGGTLHSVYGKIYIIGDSLLDGTGSTEGLVESTLASRLSTIVINNAVGGYTIPEISAVPSCSQDPSCKWTIIAGGINGDKESARDWMTALVIREVNAGKKVIIQGYLPDCGGYASGEFFTSMLDAYAEIAAATNNVWMIDARSISSHPLMAEPCNPASRPYRADDDSHPSSLSGRAFAIEAAEIIVAYSRRQRSLLRGIAAGNP